MTEHAEPAVETVPGLVDAACAVAGYVEHLRGDLRADAQQIARLCTHHGVRAVRDTGSGPAALGRFRAGAGAPVVVGCGLVLTDGVPRTREELMMVGGPAELDGLIEHVPQGTWLGVRSDDPEFFAAVGARAKARGILIAGRGAAAGAAGERGHVALVEGLTALLGHEVGQGPLHVLTAAARVRAEDVAARLVTLTERGCAVTSELVALRRAVFVRESVDAPYLEDLAPIIPHSAHLVRMRQGMGYLVGKRALEQHSGMREPSAADRRVAEDGWAVVLDALARGVRDGGVVVPASRAPQLAVLPGYGLLEEMALFAHLGIPVRRVLELASTEAARVLRLDAGALGTLTVGTGGDPRDTLLRIRDRETPPAAP